MGVYNSSCRLQLEGITGIGPKTGCTSWHFDREIFNEASHLRVPHFQTACGDRSASGRTKHERNWDEYS